MVHLFNKTTRHPITQVLQHNNLNTGVDTAMARIAVNPSSLANIRAIKTAAVEEATLNSTKDHSNTLNSFNKLTRILSCVVDGEGVEALRTTGHRLSKDVSCIIQHRKPKTHSPKVSTLMRLLHMRFQLLR